MCLHGCLVIGLGKGKKKDKERERERHKDREEANPQFFEQQTGFGFLLDEVLASLVACGIPRGSTYVDNGYCGAQCK